MEIPILVEPIGSGQFRARAGEPFALSVEGSSREEALKSLEALINDRMRNGATVVSLAVSYCKPTPQAPFHLEPLPEDDWFFKTMEEAIAENRRREAAEES